MVEEPPGFFEVRVMVHDSQVFGNVVQIQERDLPAGERDIIAGEILAL